MMHLRSLGLSVCACSAIASSALHAQRVVADTIVVRTIALQYLSNASAAKLIAPYVPVGPVTGVFEAGNGVRAITVKGSAGMMPRIDSLLKANDRAPTTVTLRLQVIAASDSVIHDASISEIDAELRNLFRFNGYRLLSQNMVRVNDNSPFTTIMRGPNGDPLTVTGGIDGAQRGGGRSVQLNVSVSHDAHTSEMLAGQVQTGRMHQELLHTELSIPIGQTVVVGSAMPGIGTPAIILVVRPELAPIRP